MILDEIRKAVAKHNEGKEEKDKIKMASFQEDKIRAFERDFSEFEHSYATFLDVIKELNKSGVETSDIERDFENKLKKLVS